MLCVACCASACGNYSVATPAQVLALEALVRSTALSGGVRCCKAVWAQEYAQALSGSGRTPRHSATGDSRREVHASLTHLGRADHRFVRQLLLACLHEPDKLVLRAALPRRGRASSPRATEHAHSRARSRAITCRSTAELSFIFVLLSKIGEWFIGTCLHAALRDGPCETAGGRPAQQGLSDPPGGPHVLPNLSVRPAPRQVGRAQGQRHEPQAGAARVLILAAHTDRQGLTLILPEVSGWHSERCSPSSLSA